MCVCVCVCVRARARACACMMYATDQCRTHLNSLWFLCVLGSRGGGEGGRVFVFPYLSLCGLFSWDCVLRVYRISCLG